MDVKTRDVDNVVIFDIEGDITRMVITGPTLHQSVKSYLYQGRRKILLNFEKVGFVDSFGVGELVGIYTSVQSLGGKLKLAKISRKLELLLRIVGLYEVLDVHPSVEDALESFPRT